MTVDRRLWGRRATVTAFLVAVVVVPGVALAAQADPGARGPWWLGAVVLVGGAAALVPQPRHPVFALAVCVGVAVAYWSAGFAEGPEPVPVVVALHEAAAGGHRRLAVGAALAALVAAGVAAELAGQPLGARDGVAAVAVVVAAVALGELVRTRWRRQADALRAAADRERWRIGQEVHDNLTHHLTVISAHAAAALHRRETRPELVEEALVVIRDASREAMGELRRTLSTVTTAGSGTTAGAGTSTLGAGGLGELPGLVRRARAAGSCVELQVLERDGLPGEVDRAAFRIVREALTNAVRHARADQITIAVRQRSGTLQLEVCDDGVGVPADVDGLGLRGMVGRADALGGWCTIDSPPTGGCRVGAELPVVELR